MTTTRLRPTRRARLLMAAGLGLLGWAAAIAVILGIFLLPQILLASIGLAP